MQQITESIYLHTDTCHVYVIKQGRKAVLIDFGDGSVLDRLPAIGVERVTDVLMTHHHRDQGQGLPRAVAAGVRIWVPHAEQDLFAAVDRHWQAREVYNSYNNREDRFSVLAPVPVAGTLKDYQTCHFGDLQLTVLPTPGHTTGSVTFLAEVDGRRVAFTGDLIAGPGQVWSLAATQWSYNGGEGIPGTILSLLDLKERQPDLLLPSHGEVITDPAGAIDLTVERLARLRELRRQNPRLFLLRERPYEPITPHLLRNRTSMANGYVLLSESGKALLIDFGYDFMFGIAAGADRASRRPWLYTLPALKRDFGVTRIEAVVPTHYHDDHVAGVNLLREAEGAEVWAPDLFADVLERPSDYDLPCLWYDPISVDRRLPLGQPVRWEEYELTLHHLPGHTHYAVAIAFEVDGRRVVAVGDQWGDGDGLQLNYVYKNGFRTADYRETAELLQRLQPDLILSGHWEPLRVEPEYLERLRERGEELERLHRALLPPDATGSGATPPVAVIRPYQVEAAPGASVAVTVALHNPFEREAEAMVRLVVPGGWQAGPDGVGVAGPAGPVPPAPRVAEPGAVHLRLGPHEEQHIAFTITPPPSGLAYRVPIAVDVTVGGRRFGQCAEALVTIRSRGEDR